MNYRESLLSFLEAQLLTADGSPGVVYQVPGQGGGSEHPAAANLSTVNPPVLTGVSVAGPLVL